MKAELEALTSSGLKEFRQAFSAENGKQAAISLHKGIRFAFVAGTIYVFGETMSAKFPLEPLKAFGK